MNPDQPGLEENVKSETSPEGMGSPISETLSPTTIIEKQSALDPQTAEKEDVGKSVITLYRGLWAEVVKDGDHIPVGGSSLDEVLTTILDIDTDWIDRDTVNFTRDRLDKAFDEGNGEQFRQLVETNNIDIDPKLLHDLLQVQKKMEALLKVDRSDASVNEARRSFYATHKNEAKLSEFKGISECAEQAIVGKILLDKIGIKSTLMEGVLNIDGENGGHSFLILDDSHGAGSLIFDIARPYANFMDGFPNVQRTETRLNSATFESKANHVVPATSIYDGGKETSYGVGDFGDFVN